uniref:Uncharacterized protein n=1 Tax=Pinguiococcus pyrenoidosus TaxID=172671 RepID=A0A7R9U8T1_9STRA
MSEYVRSSTKQSNTEEATTEGDNEDMTTGRLNLASSVPICLSATSRSQTLQLFDLIRDSAAALGSAEEYCGSPDFGTDDLKMPAICSDVVRAIQQFRGEYRIQRAPDARRLLRKQVPELSNLNDLAVDALLSYAQQCGEILVHQDATPNADSADATTSGVVVWDPNWFSSSVLGYFFQPEDWSEEIGAGRSHCMEHNDVKAHLLVCLHRAGEPFHDGQEATDKMLETLVSMIHGMQLCVPIPGREQDWFPAFLHNSNIEDFEREILALGLKAPYDGVKAHFEDLTDGEVQDGICCGRLVSLRSASRFSTPSWHLFPRGTFARFQVKVLEAFPDPMLDSWSRDQSMHSNLGRPFIDRNVVKVVWEGDSKDDRAMCICQMLYDERTQLEAAWVAWVWACTEGAARHLLCNENGHLAADNSLAIQVANQLQTWLKDAATVKTRTPTLFPYRLKKRAFLKPALSVLREQKDILAQHESESVSRFREGRSNATEADDRTAGQGGDNRKQRLQACADRAIKASFNGDDNLDALRTDVQLPKGTKSRYTYEISLAPLLAIQTYRVDTDLQLRVAETFEEELMKEIEREEQADIARGRDVCLRLDGVFFDNKGRQWPSIVHIPREDGKSASPPIPHRFGVRLKVENQSQLVTRTITALWHFRTAFASRVKEGLIELFDRSVAKMQAQQEDPSWHPLTSQPDDDLTFASIVYSFAFKATAVPVSDTYELEDLKRAMPFRQMRGNRTGRPHQIRDWVEMGQLLLGRLMAAHFEDDEQRWDVETLTQLLQKSPGLRASCFGSENNDDKTRALVMRVNGIRNHVMHQQRVDTGLAQEHHMTIVDLLGAVHCRSESERTQLNLIVLDVDRCYEGVENVAAESLARFLKREMAAM